ncbi:MAG: phosphate signaling complex protein PhoU [Kiritimatiellaeota bacterium]|nr:phosphate signaling complex protein PhoU [Kiritimatiellota bacterium]
MSVHLQYEINSLKNRMLGLCALVEDDLRQAVQAVDRRDPALARQVIEKDLLVDQSEVSIEEECLKLLALHQPVANDLRFIIAVLKLNNDLERIGDLAVNIAERALFLSSQIRLDIPYDFSAISAKTQAMLRQSIDALVHLDADLARKVGLADDEVDALNREAFNRVTSMIKAHPDDLDALIALLSVSRYLERIADHASNIAEDVLYLVEGRIVRHQHKALSKS